MDQLTQNLINGEMKILQVPYPAMSAGMVLVRNHFSLISAGTEGKTVKDARLGYIGKARARKDELKKVVDAARTFGIRDTYKMVMNKLDAPASLGYSCAGEVIAVAEDVTEFKIGDRVACGGGSANHAEVVAVPVNLCVKLAPEVPMKHAAFTTLGAIALQGVRQADVRLGENVAVIGLGLLGQLTLQLLRAAGIRTVGIDLDARVVSEAMQSGCDLAIERSKPDLEQAVFQFTSGYGVDAVIITAASSSTDPVDLAGILCRQKGRVVVVGAVPTGFQRKNYYNKELELRMSCSYGPGRYDPEYEEKAIDYPYAWTRWTENRNMQAFVELLRTEKISIEKFITHTFELKSAEQAYRIILEKSEPFLGMLLQYDLEKEQQPSVKLHDRHAGKEVVKIGMIGAGSFGQNFLLPAMKGKGDFVGVATARANNARNIGDKYGFSYCTGNADEVIADKNINTVIIATRHNLHAGQVIKSLVQNKNVFVEKPLCLTIGELEKIKEVYSNGQGRLMVGFNRRFAALTAKMKSLFIPGMQKAIHYRINAGNLPKEHWAHDPETGGGRILGEACHFIDLCMYLAESPVTSVSAFFMDDPAGMNDTAVINLEFRNGSIANVSYFSNGNKNVAKERIEIFSGGMVAVLDDFKELHVFGKKNTVIKSAVQDKGHRAEVEAFLDSVRHGLPSPVSFDEIYLSTLATLRVMESAVIKKPVSVS